MGGSRIQTSTSVHEAEAAARRALELATVHGEEGPEGHIRPQQAPAPEVNLPGSTRVPQTGVAQTTVVGESPVTQSQFSQMPMVSSDNVIEAAKSIFPAQSFFPKGTNQSLMTDERVSSLLSGYQRVDAKPQPPAPLNASVNRRVDTDAIAELEPESVFEAPFDTNQIEEAKKVDAAARNGEQFEQPAGVGSFTPIKFKNDMTSGIPGGPYKKPNAVVTDNRRNPYDDKGNLTQEAIDSAKKKSGSILTPFDKRSQALQKEAERRSLNQLRDFDRGGKIYGKLMGATKSSMFVNALVKIGLRDVAVGKLEILEAARSNPKWLNVLFTKAARNKDGGNVEIDVTDWTIQQFIDFTNRYHVWVATYKAPDVEKGDCVVRRLRVADWADRGLFIHNIVAALSNADIDGDDAMVSFDPVLPTIFADPMETIIGPDKSLKFDLKFWPPPLLFDGVSEMFVQSFIESNIINKISRSLPEGIDTSGLVGALANVGYTTTDNDYKRAWYNVVLEAHKLAVVACNGVGRRRINSIFANTLLHAYDAFQELNKQKNYLTVGNADVDSVVPLSDIPVPKKTKDLECLVWLVGEVSKAEVPPNAQEVRVMMHMYLGLNPGTNAPFRQFGNIGKAVSMNPKFIQNDGTYLMDINDDDDMRLFYTDLTNYCYAMRMQREQNDKGREFNLYDNFVTDVRSRVGLRNDINPDTGERYKTTLEWLTTFCNVYGEMAAMYNMANATVRYDLSVDDRKDTNVIKPLVGENGVITIGDVRTALSQVYPLSTIANVLPNLRAYMTQSMDPRFAPVAGEDVSNAHAKRRWWDSYKKDNDIEFWIDSSFVDMSLIRFMNENQLIRDKDNKTTDVLKRPIDFNYASLGGLYEKLGADAALEWDLFVGVADRRTSAASKFNEKTYGGKIGEPASLDSRAGMISTAAAEILALNDQGVVFTSNFYAGIGSRSLPEGKKGEALASAIKSLAAELSANGYRLRSGGAEGCDTLFHEGAGNNADIYFAAKNSKYKLAGTYHYFDKFNQEERNAAYLSVDRYHPNPKALKGFNRNLMARNYYQVVGRNGEPDVGFIACYAPKSGGTSQAIRIAEQRGIRVFNAAEYDSFEQWKLDVLDFAAKHKNLYGDSNGNPRFSRRLDANRMMYANAAANLIISAGPDYFNDICGGTPEGLLSSRWMIKLMQHSHNVKVTGGILLALVYNHHIETLNRLAARVPADYEGKAAAYMYTYNQWAFQRDKLMEKSPAWRGVIMELTAQATPDEKSFFDMMLESEADKLSDRITQKWDESWAQKESTGWLEYYEGSWFWKNRGEINGRQHPTLADLIMDLDVSIDIKQQVICDVVRWHLKNSYIQPYEIGYMLEIGNDGAFELGDVDKKSALQTYYDTSQAFNSWKRQNILAARENYRLAAAQYKNQEGVLTNTIRWLDSHPWDFVDIPDEMFAQALISVKDPTYGQTEKNSQHYGAHALFQSLSRQKNDGVYCITDIVMDRLFGVTPVGFDKKLSARDLVSLLADPDKSFAYYGPYGDVGKLDRNEIIRSVLKREPSENVEADLWDVFEKMPTLMMALRRHRTGLTPDIDGSAYVGAIENTASTISYVKDMAPTIWDSIQATKYYLRDEPAYGAIVSLATKSPDTIFDTDNKVFRRVPTVPVLEISRLMDVETYFCNQIINAAWRLQEDPYDLAGAVLDDLGASFDNIRGSLNTRFDEYCESNDIPYIENEIVRADKKTGEVISRYDERDDIAHQIYDYARDRLAKMIDTIRRSNDVMPLAEPVLTSHSIRTNKTIDRFRDSDGNPSFLSNMYETPITYDGIEYGSVEAAFQAQKYALGTKDRRKKQQAFATKWRDNPKGAKGAGARIRSFDEEEWEGRKVDVMRDLLNIKFSNPVLREMLENTGSAELIEGNDWGDTFWGVCKGKGANTLGRLLMEIRGNGGVNKPAFLGVDIASVASFNHVAVELSGSKTATMVGVEGTQTWTYGHWASYISSKDTYADLAWVLDDIDESWNGAWTSLKDENGNTIYLEITEQGSNVDMLFELAKGEDVSIKCPDGYVVKDAYTDTFNNVDSVAVFNNVRRADGAERNALKIKKTGLDLLNSIIKLDGRRKTVKVGNSMVPVDFFDIRDNLRKMYAKYADSAQGLSEVKLELAKEMQAENKKHGYDDLALGQYMSIADLMVFVVDDPNSDQNGQLCFRTLPMLLSAIRYKSGGMWAEMDTEQRIDFADSVAYDKSVNAVGVTDALGPLDILSSYYASSKAGPTYVVKGSSSFFPRNLTMLQALTKDKKLSFIDDNTARRINDTIMKVTDIRGMVTSSEFARHYDVVYATAIANRADPSNIEAEKKFIAKAAEESVMTVGGPYRLAVIGSQRTDTQHVTEVCEQCWKHGLSLLVSSINKDLIPDPYWKDAISVGSSLLLPMYELRLNGSEAHPIYPSYSLHIADPSAIARTIADPDNAYGLSDSQFAVTEEFANRVEGLDMKPLSIPVEDLFPNVYKNPKYPGHTYSKRVEFLSNDELNKFILGDNPVPCTKDYRVPYVPGSKVFEQSARDFEYARKRYNERWVSEDATTDGWVMTDIRRGDAIAWAKCIITNKYTNQKSVVITPIIPFPRGKKGKVPESCYIVDLKIARGSAVEMTYAVHRTLKNTITKVHGVDSNANKGMVDGYNTIPADLTFKDGNRLDVVVAAATTYGRKEGTENRLMTLYSLLLSARDAGYNLAFCEGSFPNHPELKERLMRQVLPMEEWRDLLDGDGVFLFTGDHGIDVFLSQQCREFMMNGHNPSHLLASMFYSEVGIYKPRINWEYDAMIIPSLRYEDLLLRWLSYMKIDCGNGLTFCPSGVNDFGRENYLFALKRSDGFDNGVIQIAAPVLINSGYRPMVAYKWMDALFGYLKFDKDSTMSNAPNVDHAKVFPDAYAVAEQLGFKIPDNIRNLIARVASSESGLPGPALNSIVVEDDEIEIDDTPQSAEDICREGNTRILDYLRENQGDINIKEMTSIAEETRAKLIDAGWDQARAHEYAQYMLDVAFQLSNGES